MEEQIEKRIAELIPIQEDLVQQLQEATAVAQTIPTLRSRLTAVMVTIGELQRLLQPAEEAPDEDARTNAV